MADINSTGNVNCCACFKSSTSDNFHIDFDSSNILPTNYNQIINKPIINGVTLEGSIILAQLGLRAIYYDTTENWNTQTSLVSEEGALYIYSDYLTVTDDVGNTTYIPGIRIGDGSSYLIDLPFLSGDSTADFYNHIRNLEIHVTAQDKEFWNNKVSSYLDPEDHENLVLSKTYYTLEGDIYNG